MIIIDILLGTSDDANTYPKGPQAFLKINVRIFINGFPICDPHI